ncbi:MAG: phenylacetate--CoA ligase [Euryarchaeota archaeon]|nr:phenylacetate--CoA ligase [Euryarchaeota archaeon]
MYEPRLETMRPEKLRELQLERLRKMSRYAVENVPMYKRRFKEAKLDPSGIRTLEDAAKIPFTVKTDLRDHYPYGILAVPIDKVVRIHASSGTTGKPTVVSYTRNDLETWARLMARTFAAAGAGPGDIVQNAYGYGLFTGGLGFHYGAERVGAAVIPSATGNTKRQLMLMKDMRTTVLCSTPSYAMYLGEAALGEGYKPKSDFKLKAGLFGAEPWSEEARARIQEVLGLRAHDCYGMSELYGPGVAVECANQKGLHIWTDEFLVETIDPETGEVLEPGKKGEMVFTMLTREAMPLLRYRTRDLAIIDHEECSCGRHHPRIMRIQGRSDDMLIIGGVNVFPSQVEHVLMNVPQIGDQYQIIVDRDLLDKLSVRAEVAQSFPFDKEAERASLAKSLESDLQALLTVHAKVELVPHGALQRSEGKAKRVIDLRKG